MLQHVPRGWPNARNILPTIMMRYVGLKSGDRLAGAQDLTSACCEEALSDFEQEFLSKTRSSQKLVSWMVCRANTVA